MAILATGMTVKVASAFGSDLTITGITKANPGVVTSTAHGLNDGDVVLFSVNGMTELNQQVVRVANKTADTFETESIDTSSYGTFTSGTCKEVSTWQTAGDANSLEAGDATPERIDITTLADTEKQYQFGTAENPEITIGNLLNPLAAATVAVRAASKANSEIPVHVTFSTGLVLIFNAYASAGDGFSASPGQPLTQPWRFQRIRAAVWYAS